MQQNPRGTKVFADEGTYPAYALEGFRRSGCASEARWPEIPEHVAKRPPPAIETSGLEQARGDWWQLNPEPGEQLWRETCWAIDTFGATAQAKQVGNVFADHVGEGTIPAPSATEVTIGGHLTVYVEYRNHGAEFLEWNSWKNWGFSRGVICNDGATRQFESLAWVSRDWVFSRFHMNSYVWVP
jgi:hypothetical protein